MKKILLILLILFGAYTAQSQILITLLLGDKLNSDKLEFGLEGGLNWSKISGLDTRNYLRDWDLGFYFDIKVKNNWSVYTGVLVKSRLGVEKLTDNDLKTLAIPKFSDTLQGNYEQKLNYFLVPALIKYKFKFNLILEGGLQFGLMYKSWIEFLTDVNGWEGRIRKYNRKDINWFDMGLVGGVGYRFIKGTGWTIDFKYYYGLLNVYKKIPGTKNSSFFINLKIPIGAGDAAKLKRERKAKEKAEKKKNKK